ncbi:MAG: sensor histidine kinase [Flavobacteriales bacterium]|nr:sensor histidine kinase [Flavobacteriales bacterium]
MLLNTSNWRIWPVIAVTLAVLFIGWDITLMSRTHVVQDRIGQQVDLLDRLGRLNSALNQLGLTHRVDVNTGQSKWPHELAAIREDVAGVSERHGAEPGMAELPGLLNKPLNACDSLHNEVVHCEGGFAQQRMPEAVFQIMLQRAQKQVDRVARSVHEQGLGQQTATLSHRWDEAQMILVLACMFAVVFALLVGMTRRLLVESRSRSEQLGMAKNDLEAINHELRETMLSKEEKEVMIKEIHHRVKNNLQIVRSLIRFQQDQVNDARTRELFNECINRVGAMALVHEQTYLSKDLANIPVSTYLDSLVRDLVNAYNIRKRLTMDIDIQVKTLSVDTLIPLGLLINEIISNSFKYAFADRETGTITVHLTGSEGEGLQLVIGDDGVGMRSRDGFHRPNSLGMELIHTLASQLDAEIRLLDGPGTRYELMSHRLHQRKVA